MFQHHPKKNPNLSNISPKPTPPKKNTSNVSLTCCLRMKDLNVFEVKNGLDSTLTTTPEDDFRSSLFVLISFLFSNVSLLMRCLFVLSLRLFP